MPLEKKKKYCNSSPNNCQCHCNSVSPESCLSFFAFSFFILQCILQFACCCNSHDVAIRMMFFCNAHVAMRILLQFAWCCNSHDFFCISHVAMRMMLQFAWCCNSQLRLSVIRSIGPTASTRPAFPGRRASAPRPTPARPTAPGPHAKSARASPPCYTPTATNCLGNRRFVKCRCTHARIPLLPECLTAQMQTWFTRLTCSKLFKCWRNAQMHNCWSVQMLKGPNAQLLKCSNARKHN